MCTRKHTDPGGTSEEKEVKEEEGIREGREQAIRRADLQEGNLRWAAERGQHGRVVGTPQRKRGKLVRREKKNEERK